MIENGTGTNGATNGGTEMNTKLDQIKSEITWPENLPAEGEALKAAILDNMDNWFAFAGQLKDVYCKSGRDMMIAAYRDGLIINDDGRTIKMADGQVTVSK